MSESEIKYKLEIIRLTSLCRYAASELRALDEIIMQRHPMSSGLPESLVSSLEGKGDASFVKKYKDLLVAKKALERMLENVTQSDEMLEDLEIEIR